jgi:uncharacterized SAM-binding protein YcdF (DUF218 family)
MWRLAGVLGVVAVAWTGGLFWFVREIPDHVADTTTRTDAIVVLTGGSERLSAGLELLKAKLADKLFISGVYRGVDLAELLRLSQQESEELSCCIMLGYDAEDTVGNALESAAWMAKNGFHSLRIVTANYHIPRGLMEFSRVLPKTKMIPNPVFPAQVRIDAWWRWPGTSRLVIGEYHKFLAASLRDVPQRLFCGES